MLNQRDHGKPWSLFFIQADCKDLNHEAVMIIIIFGLVSTK